VNQKRRGEKAAIFKKGRADEFSIPVMLAGVECMAEGHSFHLANNVILLAYSWAADKFKQALDRVHRLNSVRGVNIYVVVCQGTIDLRLESLTDEKTDAAELVLDGRLIGERPEEVNLAELLKVAKREFNTRDNTIDEGLLHAQWPKLRDRLSMAMREWEPVIEVPLETNRVATAKSVPELLTLEPPAMLPSTLRGEPLELFMKSETKPTKKTQPKSKPAPNGRFQVPTLPPNWKERLKIRTGKLSRVQRSDIWSQL
jgi:hypothetical protein